VQRDSQGRNSSNAFAQLQKQRPMCV